MYYVVIESYGVVEIDVFGFMYGIVNVVMRGWYGMKVFDCMEVMLWMWVGVNGRRCGKGGKGFDGDGFVLMMVEGFYVKVWRIVVVLGYELLNFFWKKLVKCYSMYVFVMELLEELMGWLGKWLIWEMVWLYVYVWMMGDGCVIIGGYDEEFCDL